MANRPALDGEIAAIFGRFPHDEMTATLRRARIAFASVNSVAELSSHQQLRRAGVDSPSGPLELVAPPIRMRGENYEARPVPATGQHSRALREEFADVSVRRKE